MIKGRTGGLYHNKESTLVMGKREIGGDATGAQTSVAQGRLNRLANHTL